MVNVIFTQPFLVNAALAEKAQGRVVVLDIAFNGGSPAGKGTNEEQFVNTTVAFIDALGDRLVCWVDHHPHRAWSTYENDPRFVLKPRDEAPACPPIITPFLVHQCGDFDTIVAHGDFDGVISAVKFALGGKGPYVDADADSIAADSRIGEMSLRGQRFEEALKSNLKDDSIRQDVFNELYVSDMQAAHRINVAQEKYVAIQRETQRLAGLYEINGRVAYLDISENATPCDYTALLLAGQKLAEVSVVRDSINDGKDGLITIAGPRNWNFVQMFGLSGGMPNRVNLPDQDVSAVITKINEA